MPRKRFARREDLGLTRAEFAVLRRLSTPQKIQAFLYGLKQNFELHGDTCRPVRVVLRTRSAHCIEGAMLAACALWVHGRPPLLMDMRAVRDFDHVVTLIRRNGCWGAISKTNAIGLRWRDPVYRSLRELAMSYFHEYTNKIEHKTLREYSIPFDLRAIDPKIWVSGEKNLDRARAPRGAAALPAGRRAAPEDDGAARPLRAPHRRHAPVPPAARASGEARAQEGQVAGATSCPRSCRAFPGSP